MKFDVELSMSAMRTVQVFADDREGAVRAALEGNTGFVVESVTELGDGDAELQLWPVIAACDGCGRTIFEGDNFAASEEVALCSSCFDPAEGQEDHEGANPDARRADG